MLKKICLLLTALVLLLSAAAAFAEPPDLSQMTFEELQELRAKIGLEMQTRPEGAEIVLTNGGTFVVGRDLQPGTYYFVYDDSLTGSAFVKVFEDETKSRPLCQIMVSTASYSVYTLTDLKEGNCVEVGFTIRLSKAGFPAYVPPEGTVIPQGAYEVGVDIPAGRYSVHEGTKGCQVVIYRDWDHHKTGNQWTAEEFLTLYALHLSGVVTLTEGQIFVVEKNSVIMNKYTPAFTFE